MRLEVVRRTPRAALTLVEMMVAMTVTMLIILSLAQAFAIIGTSVDSKRSILELTHQVRVVASQLQGDSSSLTVPARPWPDRNGYLEIIEREGNDNSPLFARPGGVRTPVVMSTLFGDFDDVLMFTSRRVDSSFVGQVALPGPDGGWGVAGQDDDQDGIIDNLNEVAWPGSDDMQTFDSNLAEVIWFTSYRERDGDGVPTPGAAEITLHRRVLLVRPDLAPMGDQLIGEFYSPSTSSADLQRMAEHLRRFVNVNDTSIRKVVFQQGNSIRIRIFANSLEDLTQRENRFAHSPALFRITDTTNGNTVGYAPALSISGVAPQLPRQRLFPFPVQLGQIALGNNLVAVSVTALSESVQFNSQVLNIGGQPVEVFSGQLGEDVALSQVLGFDVKVYDPFANLRVFPGADGRWGVANTDDDGDGTPDNATEAGWAGSDDSPAMTISAPLIQRWLANLSNPAAAGNVQAFEQRFPVVGRGAYVDLAYAQFLPPAFLNVRNNPRLPTHFSSIPTGMLPTYDTWTFFYEHDGVNQNGNTVNLSRNLLDDNDNGLVDEPAEAALPLIDEGMNGIDENGIGGVDDPTERETSPPYAAPLRGIQIQLRVYEPSTRQVRQATISVDYLPE